ncbi:MAG: hypothetical protein ABSE70_01750 [Candidatus Limnocylindrales bacterium]
MNRMDRIEGRQGRGLHVRLVLSAAMAISLAACTVGGESPSVGPEASASDSATSQTPTENQTLETWPLVSESAAPTATSMACARMRGSGRWTGLNWSVEKSRLPAQASGEDGMEGTFTLYAWSKGYLGFRPDPVAEGASAQEIQIDASTDGLSWSVVQALTITPSAGLSLPISIVRVVEGPAGLLALGTWAGQRADFPAKRPVAVVLRSIDGRHWIYDSAAAVFGSVNVGTVDARSIGYVATGWSNDGQQALVWVSSDGSAWRKSQLPGPAGIVPVDITAFGGGYLLLAAVVGDESAGTVTPSLWWSADGLQWDQAAVPGMRPGGTLLGDMYTAVERINDHALLATEYTYDAPTQTSTQTAWVSTDGRTWCRDDAASAVWPGQMVSYGDRGLYVEPTRDYSGPTAIRAFRDDFSLVELAQSGSVPPGEIVQMALGPAGLVATDYNGSVFYLGVPTSD